MAMKHSIIMAFMGGQKDRFCTYFPHSEPEEKMAKIQQVEGIDGVEIVYPFEISDPTETAKQLKKYGLGVAAVNANIKGGPAQQAGSSSVPQKEIRDDAIRIIKEAMDIAAELGADKVTTCPLTDGYDYLMTANYQEAWLNMVDTFRQAASHRSDIKLFLEFKDQESRVKCFLDNTAKTICMIRDIGLPNLGVTLDIGHSLMAQETPGEAISLCHTSNIPYYIHTNDNNGRWDWDLIPTTYNLWHYLEAFVYLKRYGYDGWLTSDMSPIRLDRVDAFDQNLKATQKIIDIVDSMDMDELFGLMHRCETVEILQYLRDHTLK